MVAAQAQMQQLAQDYKQLLADAVSPSRPFPLPRAHFGPTSRTITFRVERPLSESRQRIPCFRPIPALDRVGRAARRR
jgi:hypothetical protein